MKRPLLFSARPVDGLVGGIEKFDELPWADLAHHDIGERVAAAAAIAMIRELTQEAEIGKLYLGIVKRTVDFGAFIEIFPGTEGLVHISHLANERVDQTTDVVNEGDEVLVRVIEIDRRSGKIRLSRKEALEAANAARGGYTNR